jgi:hypothetical protein
MYYQKNGAAMIRDYIVLIVIIGISSSAPAKGLQEKSTLTFINNRTVVVPESIAYKNKCFTENNCDVGATTERLHISPIENVAYFQKTEELAVSVETDKIITTIKEIKEKLCQTVGNGQIKFWMKSDFEGKFLGIGGSAESGIEVAVLCENFTKMAK